MFIYKLLVFLCLLSTKLTCLPLILLLCKVISSHCRRFLYSEQIPEDEQEVKDLLIVADKYLIAELKRNCEEVTSCCRRRRR